MKRLPGELGALPNTFIMLGEYIEENSCPISEERRSISTLHAENIRTPKKFIVNPAYV
jgi:hypothetical protein